MQRHPSAVSMSCEQRKRCAGPSHRVTAGAVTWLLAEAACVEHRLVDFLDLGVADDRPALWSGPITRTVGACHDLHAVVIAS